MKQKGFTLVELLAVITVLAIIALLVVPTISRSFRESTQNLIDAQIVNIKDAAKSWGADHVDTLPDTQGGSTVVTVGQLKQGGYLDKNITNPKTKKKLEDSIKVTIYYRDGNYEYQVEAIGE